MNKDCWKGFIFGIMVMMTLALFVFIITQISLRMFFKKGDFSFDIKQYSRMNKGTQYAQPFEKQGCSCGKDTMQEPSAHECPLEKETIPTPVF